jgi:negative regulator of replication initiation
MAPTVRVDDEVYQRLKDEAEPFVDSPNSVLRRLLGLDASVAEGNRQPRSRQFTGRAKTGEILDRRAYDRPILKALARRGGSGRVNEILDEVGEVVADQLTERDHEVIKSGAVRWRNRAMWRRLRLVEAGLLRDDSPRGVWELTKAGEEAASQRDLQVP